MSRYFVCIIECDVDILGNVVTIAPSLTFYIYCVKPLTSGIGVGYPNDPGLTLYRGGV